MKYQITCDNCGTQFIVEAGEGQVIECQCPHCKGIMEITLPIVSDNVPSETIEDATPYSENQNSGKTSQNSNRFIVLFVITGLLLIILAIGVYFTWLRPANNSPEQQTTTMDTIPYQVEQEPEVEEPIETSVVPETPELPDDTVRQERYEEKQINDTAAIGGKSRIIGY